ncbi:universal stress protein [Aquabacterium sp. G14]|uniref:universal stress protein n=1 Tax=Aquabacterium sp. G14 TaxID=3130164 RepID=UPI0030A71EF7
MTNDQTSTAIPKRLMLATDLSARCDRALDRAGLLAESWGAALVAVNVLDVANTPDQILAWAGRASEREMREIALHELRRNTQGVKAPITLRVERGDEPADVLCNVADEVQADLVVSSVARSEVLGRFLLGSTVEQLARRLTQPLLIVRQRARQPYRRIVVATDLSAGAHAGLQAAARLFPGQPLQLYHAHDVPLAGLAGRADEAPPVSRTAQQACEALLAETPLPPSTAVSIQCERGAVASTLPSYVRTHDVDLVVLGIQARAGLLGALLGSTALRLLQWLPSDVLLVRSD